MDKYNWFVFAVCIVVALVILSPLFIGPRNHSDLARWERMQVINELVQTKFGVSPHE